MMNPIKPENTDIFEELVMHMKIAKPGRRPTQMTRSSIDSN